jgi:sugar-specific transcriptional regulator TrmB
LAPLSKEQIIKALRGLGLSSVDVQVYVFLASKGPHEMREITSVLNLSEDKVHGSLKELLSISIVKPSIEHPLEFNAMPFEEVIDLFIDVKKEQAKNIRESKKKLLSNWLPVIKNGSET